MVVITEVVITEVIVTDIIITKVVVKEVVIRVVDLQDIVIECGFTDNVNGGTELRIVEC